MMKYACPCCRRETLNELPPGTYEICPYCGWEDDPVQFSDPHYVGGANVASLNQARKDLRISEKIFTAFPELRREPVLGNMTLPYVVYETCLVPYIKEQLHEGSHAACSRIFEFLEEMACDPEEAVQNLLLTAVLEAIRDDQAAYREAVPWMLPQTRKADHLLDQYFSPA